MSCPCLAWLRPCQAEKMLTAAGAIHRHQFYFLSEAFVMTISYFTIYNPRTQECWVGQTGWMREAIAVITRYEPEDLPFLRGGRGDLSCNSAKLKPLFGVKKS